MIGDPGIGFHGVDDHLDGQVDIVVIAHLYLQEVAHLLGEVGVDDHGIGKNTVGNDAGLAVKSVHDGMAQGDILHQALGHDGASLEHLDLLSDLKGLGGSDIQTGEGVVQNLLGGKGQHRQHQSAAGQQSLHHIAQIQHQPDQRDRGNGDHADPKGIADETKVQLFLFTADFFQHAQQDKGRAQNDDHLQRQFDPRVHGK